MAKTQQKPKTKTDKVAEPARSAGAVAVSESAPAQTGMRLRIPYPKNWGATHNVTPDRWKVLIDTAWPAARSAEAVCLAIEYCRWRNLDPLKKMVHVVPVYAKDGGGYDSAGKPIGGMIETVWPGIAEIRVTATRTGSYAGKDDTAFGPDVTETFKHKHDGKETEKTVTYPEWAQVTVYRIVQGVRSAFVGPKVRWKEAYSTESRWSPIPNEMWAERPHGQLEKCAEAGALRLAFPEELGGEQSAEEMYGRTVDHAPHRMIPDGPPMVEGEMRPAQHQASEFSRVEVVAGSKTETVEGPSPQPEPPATLTNDKPGVDPAWFADRKANLATCAKIAEVAELCEVVEQDLPPESAELKEWQALAKAKTDEIMNAKRGQK